MGASVETRRRSRDNEATTVAIIEYTIVLDVRGYSSRGGKGLGVGDMFFHWQPPRHRLGLDADCGLRETTLRQLGLS